MLISAENTSELNKLHPSIDALKPKQKIYANYVQVETNFDKVAENIFSHLKQ